MAHDPVAAVTACARAGYDHKRPAGLPPWSLCTDHWRKALWLDAQAGLVAGLEALGHNVAADQVRAATCPEHPV
jgi:hypothetical protein